METIKILLNASVRLAVLGMVVLVSGCPNDVEVVATVQSLTASISGAASISGTATDSGRDVILSWQNPSGANYEGISISHRKMSEDSFSEPVSIDKTDTNHIVPNLEYSTDYVFRVTTMKSGLDSQSQTVMQAIPSINVIVGDLIIDDSDRGAGFVRIGWSNPASFGYDYHIIEYRQHGQGSYEAYYRVPSLAGSTVAARIAGLNPSTGYDVRVKSGIGGGEVFDGVVIENVTTSALPSSEEPTNFQASVNGTAVEISWTRQSGGPASFRQQYIILKGGSDLDVFGFTSINTMATSISVSAGDLEENTLYHVIIINTTTIDGTTLVSDFGGSFTTGNR